MVVDHFVKTLMLSVTFFLFLLIAFFLFGSVVVLRMLVFMFMLALLFLITFPKVVHHLRSVLLIVVQFVL